MPIPEKRGRAVLCPTPRQAHPTRSSYVIKYSPPFRRYSNQFLLAMLLLHCLLNVAWSWRFASVVHAQDQALRPLPESNGQPTAQVIVTAARLNIRSGPGASFAVIGKALSDEVFVVQGRNMDGSWVQLAVPDLADKTGWVAAPYVVVSDPIANLPVTAAASTATTAVPVAPPLQQPATDLQGKLVIQSKLGSTFYLYDLGTGELRPLTNGRDPAISPDGTQIAFARRDVNGIYLINIDGTNERRIFGDREALTSPKWSPDGKWIVFGRSDGDYKCHRIERRFCYTHSQLAEQYGLPDWPELIDLLFEDYLVEERHEYMISRVAADGSAYRDLPALPSARSPDWHAGGIVYQSADGLQLTQDTDDGKTAMIYRGGWDWDPDWHPNGDRIVFQTNLRSRWEILIINRDGSGVAALTRPVTKEVNPLPSNVSPVWSPDGQHIAFLSNRTETNEAGAWRVWVMNADGSNQRPLPINLEITYEYHSEQMIDWGK